MLDFTSSVFFYLGAGSIIWFMCFVVKSCFTCGEDSDEESDENSLKKPLIEHEIPKFYSIVINTDESICLGKEIDCKK